MTPPTPPPVRTEPEFDYAAKLSDLDPTATTSGPPWYVTFGFGKPAAGTYSEVAFTAEALIGDDAEPHPEHVLDAVVRRVAVDLYGTAWAFHYRPDEYADAIGRWNLRRRERVVVSSVEVWA